jgi:hypothetical protein
LDPVAVSESIGRGCADAGFRQIIFQPGRRFVPATSGAGSRAASTAAADYCAASWQFVPTNIQGHRELLLGWLCHLFPDDRNALTIVRPETIVRWHRAGFVRTGARNRGAAQDALPYPSMLAS